MFDLYDRNRNYYFDEPPIYDAAKSCSDMGLSILFYLSLMNSK